MAEYFIIIYWLFLCFFCISFNLKINFLWFCFSERQQRIYNEVKNDLIYDDEKYLELSPSKLSNKKNSVALIRYVSSESKEKLGCVNDGISYDGDSPMPLCKSFDIKNDRKED